MIGDDELDRILAAEDAGAPGDEFTTSVMAAVAREAAAPPVIPFPWSRALLGLAAFAAAVGLAVGAGALRADPADFGLADLVRLGRGTFVPETLSHLWLAGLVSLMTVATAGCSSWLVTGDERRG